MGPFLATSSGGDYLNCGTPCRVIVTASLTGAANQSMTVHVSELDLKEKTSYLRNHLRRLHSKSVKSSFFINKADILG